jgi:hypothetical protein
LTAFSSGHFWFCEGSYYGRYLAKQQVESGGGREHDFFLDRLYGAGDME